MRSDYRLDGPGKRDVGKVSTIFEFFASGFVLQLELIL
jgi:hypothetical protein